MNTEFDKDIIAARVYSNLVGYREYAYQVPISTYSNYTEIFIVFLSYIAQIQYIHNGLWKIYYLYYYC